MQPLDLTDSARKLLGECQPFLHAVKARKQRARRRIECLPATLALIPSQTKGPAAENGTWCAAKGSN